MTVVLDRPIELTLWHFDGTGLRIWSSMRHVAEWREIGVLCFETVTTANSEAKYFDVYESFGIARLAIKRMSISESGKTGDSGIVLRAQDNQQILVVAGGDPCTLAVDGIPSAPYSFEPEYPLDDYEFSEFSD